MLPEPANNGLDNNEAGEVWQDNATISPSEKADIMQREDACFTAVDLRGLLQERNIYEVPSYGGSGGAPTKQITDIRRPDRNEPGDLGGFPHEKITVNLVTYEGCVD